MTHRAYHSRVALLELMAAVLDIDLATLAWRRLGDAIRAEIARRERAGETE